MFPLKTLCYNSRSAPFISERYTIIPFHFLKVCINKYPTKIPIIPSNPSNLFGAGIGNFIKAKTNPTINPVKKDKIISLSFYPKSSTDNEG